MYANLLPSKKHSGQSTQSKARTWSHSQFQSISKSYILDYGFESTALSIVLDINLEVWLVWFYLFSCYRYLYNNDDTRLWIAFPYLSRLLSVPYRFSLSNLRRHALLGRSLLCIQALSTDGEERFNRNILEQIILKFYALVYYWSVSIQWWVGTTRHHKIYWTVFLSVSTQNGVKREPFAFVV